MSGGYYTCARTTSNAVYCWGQNNFGQLGDGTTVNRNEPVAVPWPCARMRVAPLTLRGAES